MSKFTFHIRIIVANLIGYWIMSHWYGFIRNYFWTGFIHSSVLIAFGTLMFYGSMEAWYWDKPNWTDIYYNEWREILNV